MSLAFVPTFSPAVGSTLYLTLPMRLWTPSSRPVGGSGVANGVPESFIIRRDQLLSVRLRFYEVEWPFVGDLFDSLQLYLSSGFTFYPDYLRNPSTYILCYLEEPVPPNEIKPERDDSYIGAYHLDAVFRSMAGGRFDLRAVV